MLIKLVVIAKSDKREVVEYFKGLAFVNEYIKRNKRFIKEVKSCVVVER